MGWYGTNNSTLKSTLAELTTNEDRTEMVDGRKRRWVRTTLAHCFRGNIRFKGVLWSVVKVQVFWDDVLSQSSVFIHCDVLEYAKRHNGWLYKPMDEACGPYYWNCPFKYLAMAPVENQNWREGVLEYHRQRKQKRINKQVA